MTDRGLRALRILAGGHTLTLLASSGLFWTRWVTATAAPVHVEGMPPFLESPGPFYAALGIVAALGAVAAFVGSRATAVAWATTLLGVGLYATLHQLGIGWAGANLLLWTGAWACWLVTADRGLAWGARLGLVLLGGLFLWPALGKLNPAYTTGDLFWELFWAPGEGPHAVLGALLGEELHRGLSRIYGPVAIVGELALACCWMLPPRFAFRYVAFVLIAMMVSSSLYFVDAIGLLMSLTVSAASLDASFPELGASPSTSRKGSQK